MLGKRLLAYGVHYRFYLSISESMMSQAIPIPRDTVMNYVMCLDMGNHRRMEILVCHAVSTE